MVPLDATKSDNTIHISEDSFEHLLSCLDNQKFMGSRNADSTTCDADAVDRQNQSAIDDFNTQCRELLHGQ